MKYSSERAEIGWVRAAEEWEGRDSKKKRVVEMRTYQEYHRHDQKMEKPIHVDFRNL